MVINAIAYTYQALGYHVLLLSSHLDCGAYCVEEIITDDYQLLGKDSRKCILLINEQAPGDKLPESLTNIFLNYEFLTVGFIT